VFLKLPFSWSACHHCFLCVSPQWSNGTCISLASFPYVNIRSSVSLYYKFKVLPLLSSDSRRLLWLAHTVATTGTTYVYRVFIRNALCSVWQELQIHACSRFNIKIYYFTLSQINCVNF
jgi:hypothetical protein